MIYIKITNGTVELSNIDDKTAQSRWDWKSYETVQDLAAKLSVTENKLYIGVDKGSSVSPRFDIIEAPAIGDEVSYAFNGDSYPCGKIVKISKSLRRIETDGGKVFYRRKLSGTWLNNHTWALVNGHVHTQNPHF